MAPYCRAGAAAWLVAALAAIDGPSAALAQVHLLSGDPAPQPYAVHTLHAFFVNEGAKASFINVAGVPSGDLNSGLAANMPGLELHLMRYGAFQRLTQQTRFCASEEDVRNGLAHTSKQLLVNKTDTDSVRYLVRTYPMTATARAAAAQDAENIVNSVRPPQTAAADSTLLANTGVYVLVAANCGGLDLSGMTGQVVVKQTYGYLPANEHPKLPLVCVMTAVYSVILAVWLVILVRHKENVFRIHQCIAVVVFLSALECAVWSAEYTAWNHSGHRMRLLSALALLATVAKSTLSHMLVLVASLGWGVTRPYLDRGLGRRIQLFTVAYIVVSLIGEVAVSHRHSHALPKPTVIAAMAIASLMNGALFAWVFSALSGLMETLKERDQNEKLALFRKLWAVLVAAVGMAVLSVLLQVVNTSRSMTSRWKQQWLISDLGPRFLFLVVLAAIMLLWSPHQNNAAYALFSQVPMDDNPKAGSTEGDTDP